MKDKKIDSHPESTLLQRAQAFKEADIITAVFDYCPFVWILKELSL